MAPTTVVTAELERIITEGEALERARRWGEALSHYEAAAKQFPEQTGLSERLTRSRIRFDLARRYADSSDTGLLTEWTTAIRRWQDDRDHERLEHTFHAPMGEEFNSSIQVRDGERAW